MGKDEGPDSAEDYPRNYDELMREQREGNSRTTPLYRRGKDLHEGEKTFHRKSVAKQAAQIRRSLPRSSGVIDTPAETTQLPALTNVASLDAHRRLRRPDNVLVMAEGKIRMHGSYHTISSRTRNEPLQIWSAPPGTEEGQHLDDILDVRVFVVKDSEVNGWANVVVLEITPPGERQKLRHFTDRTGQDHVVCSAKASDIQNRRNK
jgi:hypothetical protein